MRVAACGFKTTMSWSTGRATATAPERVRAEQKVKAMIESMGGVFNANPFAMTAFGGNRIIAHPLGGCAMGETVEKGVVAPDGRVFDPTKGPKGVHDGLYVCDGAAVPSAIGVSPLLTITALAERAMMLAAEQLQRKLDVDATPLARCGMPRCSEPTIRAALVERGYSPTGSLKEGWPAATHRTQP